MCILYLILRMSNFNKSAKGAKKKFLDDKMPKNDATSDSLSNKTVTVVNTWIKLATEQKGEAMHAAFVLLMSDFLFSNIALPQHWIRRLVELKMLKIPKNNKPAKALSDPMMVVVEMLFKAQDFVAEKLSESRYDLLGIVDFIVRVEFTGMSFEKVITHAKGQEQMEKICKHLLQAAEQRYTSHDSIMTEVDMTMREFASSYDRRLLVALLVGRALASIILKLGDSGGSLSIVSDMMAITNDPEEAIWHRKNGNDHFLELKYDKALVAYTTAISLSKFSALTYCNRCQAALKLRNFKLAISDGYRAIALKPRWGKAYYRQAEAFKEDNRLIEAKLCNKRGLQLADNESEKEELLKQRSKFGANDEESKSNNSDSGSSKKESKKVKKAKKQKNNSEICPNLISDEDSMYEFSGDEMEGTEYYKNQKLIEKQDLEIKKAKMKISALKKANNESEGGSEKNGENGSRHSKTKKSKSTGDIKDETDRKQNSKKSGGQQKKVKETPLTRSQSFADHKMKGSKALIAKKYPTAIKEYDLAITILENQVPCKDFPKIGRVDRFLLICARGWVSLEVRSPPEVAKSLDFFSMLLGTNTSTADVVHPMVYYGVAFAQYLLNNFFLITSPLNLGMKMIKEKRVMPMKWPGIDTVIPESEPDKLYDLMNELIRIPQHPPKAEAICFYVQCGKDYENISYSMCDKEYHRKEIYLTDYNFEGYMKLQCSWDCVICFHYKCWSKFKHNNYKKTGDKDVLDSDCLTDGCKGLLCRIIMIDEKLKVKKDLLSEKLGIKDKEESKKMPGSKMSKNERNLTKRKKQMEEAKDRKQQSKKKTDEPNASVPAKAKPESSTNVRVFTDEDLKSATILRRHNNNEIRLKNPKIAKSKKRSDAITLNAFLANSRNKLEMREIEQVIINSQAMDAPFQVPDELRDEIAQFESELSDEDIFWTSCIYEYFENFFEVNGPVKVQEDLLLQQQLHFTDKMKKVIDKHNDIISFLLKNQYRFLIVPPYIGLPQQQAQIKKLADEFQKSLKPKKPSRPPPSSVNMLDTLDCDFDGPSTLSDFARDLYDVGEVSLSEVCNITGSGAPVALVTGRDPDETMFPSQPSVPAKRNDAPPKQEPVQPKHTPWMGAGMPNTGRGDELDNFLCTEMDRFLQDHPPPESTSHSQPFVGAFGDGGQRSEDLEEETSESSIFEELASCDGNGVHVATQVDMLHCDGELETLRQEREIVDKTVADLSMRLSNLTTSSRAAMESKTKELEELKKQLDNAKNTSITQNKFYENEMKKLAQERRNWQENIVTIRDKLNEAQTAHKEMESRIRSKEEDCDRLSRNYQEQRNSWLEEKAKLDLENDKLKKQLLRADGRILEAEIKALECEKNYSLKTLFKARSDCERIVFDFEKLMRHHSNSQPAQAEVLKGYRKWKTNIDTCTQYIEQAKQQFQVNCELLRNGKHLNELTQVQVPTPPPPGPNIQQVAMIARQISAGNMPGSMAPPPVSINAFMQQPPTPATPPSFSGNGSDSISPLSTTRTPQPPIGTGKQQPSPIGTGMPQVAPIGTQPVPSLSKPANSLTPPLPAATHNDTSTSSSQPKGSFEKIMVQLQRLFPTVTRPDLALCIKEVRQNNNNSLTGLSFDDIVQQASVVVTRKKNLQPNSSNTIGGMSSNNSNSSWPFGSSRGPQNSSATYNLDDACVICHDPLKLFPIQQLKCGHTYHNKCLNKWLERNRTCPTCRDYAIDTNEFPTLATLTR